MASELRRMHQLVLLSIVIICLSTVLGGCSAMFPSQRRAPAGPPVQPLSDDEARAQVIGPAREVVKAANLEITYATFEWESCNDQGEPPYHGRVDVAVVVPPGVSSQTLSKQVAAAAAEQPGWAPGAPHGMRPFGELAHKGNVMVIVGPGNYPARAEVQVFGECRNMNNHRDHTGPFEVTSELRG